MKSLLAAGAVMIATSALCTARADTTGMTGAGVPFDNLQPSVAVTEAMPFQGLYPPLGGGGIAEGDTLGFIYGFAGNFAPGSSRTASGQLLPIAQNELRVCAARSRRRSSVGRTRGGGWALWRFQRGRVMLEANVASWPMPPTGNIRGIETRIGDFETIGRAM